MNRKETNNKARRGREGKEEQGRKGGRREGKERRSRNGKGRKERSEVGVGKERQRKVFMLLPELNPRPRTSRHASRARRAASSRTESRTSS